MQNYTINYQFYPDMIPKFKEVRKTKVCKPEKEIMVLLQTPDYVIQSTFKATFGVIKVFLP